MDIFYDTCTCSAARIMKNGNRRDQNLNHYDYNVILYVLMVETNDFYQVFFNNNNKKSYIMYVRIIL